jgi:peroxiredoxin
MNRLILSTLALAALAAGGFFALVRSGGTRPVAAEGPAEPEKHRVTAGMLMASDAMTRLAAPTFRLKGTDGVSYALDELAGESPVVLVFIKDGCPCSSDAQRFFNRLHAAYGREVKFLGVIDVDTDKGRAWGQKNATSFPLVADPGLEAVRAYKAESSAYLAVVDKGGAIDRLYPGYSKEMLVEASERIARLAGVTPRPIDATGAPDELSTGCPF